MGIQHKDALPRLSELLGVHLVGTDERELRAHVAGCPTCADRLRTLRRINAALRGGRAPLSPPGPLARRLLAVPAREPPRPQQRPGRVASAAVAAIVVGLAVALALTLLHGGESLSAAFVPTRTVVLEAAARAPVRASVELAVPRGDRIPIRLVASGLPHGQGRYYGLWLTGASGEISGGSFRPQQDGRCVILMLVPAADWRALAITNGDRPPSGRTTIARASL